MNKLTYHFTHSQAYREFSHNAFTWLKDNVSGCYLDIESGRAKHQEAFAPTLMEAVGLELTPDIVINGKCRAKLWKGKGWSMARVFTNSLFKEAPRKDPDRCSFYLAFADDVYALQFKLVMG